MTDDGRSATALLAPRVCVLGEPVLQHGSTTVTLSGRRARVLAGLVSAPRGLSLDQLCDIVWPVDPPNSARAALHVHLGGVRKALAGAPSGLTVIREGSLYRLELDGWVLDADLVSLLREEASRATESGDHAHAVELLGRALALWRGPAFAVDGEPVAVGASFQLELTRLDLEEAQVEAQLRAGELVLAEGRSAELVEAEPYRERRWALLLRARALQDRPADALATYDEARRRLVEELGIEPGEELRRLERSVLANDGGVGDLGPVDGAGAFGDVPTSLTPLVGRKDEVRRVESALALGAPVLLLGAPGAGKTRVAAEVAEGASAGGRPVGWVDLRNAAFDDRSMGDRIRRWARQHAGGVVVLDNAESAVEAVGALVESIRRIAPKFGVIVTSRVPIPAEAAVVLIDSLSLPPSDEPGAAESAESVTMLQSLLAVLAPGVDISPSEAAAVCRRMGGLPLGIRLAAELARSIPLTEIAPQSSATFASELEGAVAAALDCLQPGDRVALASLSVVAGQLDAELVAALLGEGAPVHDIVDRLAHHGLLQYEPGADAPYSIPEPIREVGVSFLAEEERRVVLGRLVDDCIERAEAMSIPTAVVEGGELRTVVARQLPWHRQALEHLADIGDDERALELVSALELSVYALGWWRTNTELQDVALGIPGPPSPLRARVHAVRGRPGPFHEHDEDHLRAALRIAEQVDDPASWARGGYALAIRRWWQGRHADALDLLERCRASAEQAGDLFLIGEALRFTGIVLVCSGEPERGFALQCDLLEQVERTPALELLVPHLCMHLGHCRRHVGDDDAAIADLDRARVGFEQVGNHSSFIHVCGGMAEVHADHGRHGDALALAARALETATSVDIDTYDAWILATVARVHAALDHETLARSAAARAVSALSRSWVGETHHVAAELATVSILLGEPEAAARLIGVADATPDQRELPFRSPAEAARLMSSRAAAESALGARYAEVHERGTASTPAEAAARLIEPGRPV